MPDVGYQVSSRCGVRHCPPTLLKLVAAVVTAVLVLTPRTVAAHTDDELDSWKVGWGRQVISAGLTDELSAEWEDWANRHRRYFGRTIPRATHMHPVAPQRSAVGSSVEQWRPLVETYFRAGDVGWAMRVMNCESGGNSQAKNPGSSASGLFQNLARYWPSRSVAAGWAGADIFDPEANIAVASWLYYLQPDGGPRHWVCK